MNVTDRQWFEQFPERQARIRDPFGSELATEFHMLGPHKKDRRRILVWRAPEQNRLRLLMFGLSDGLMRVPFLAFSDEAIANEDAVLLPLLDSIMRQAAEGYGMQPAEV